MKLTQGIIHLSVFGLLFQAQLSRSEELNWQVRPSVCVQERASDECHLSVVISAGNELNTNNGERYCVLMDELVLKCALSDEFPINTVLTISQQTELLIKNKQEKTVFSQTILLKSTQAKKQRYRVRSPWSLF